MIRRANECKEELREHMRDGDGTVNAGDVAICPAGTGHSIANRSDETLELIAVIVYA